MADTPQPTRPVFVPKPPSGADEAAARLSALPTEDEFDAEREFVFRADSGDEAGRRMYALRRKWHVRGFDKSVLDAMEQDWRRELAKADPFFATEAEETYRAITDNESANGDTMRLTVDAADWLDAPDLPDRPVVDGLIEENEAIAIVGSAKAGKSFLALQLAICIAAGIPFLGRPVHRHSVLVANLEVADRQYKKRLRRMVDTLRLAPEALRGWLTIQNLKEGATTWDTLRADADFYAAEVVMVDPFYQIFQGEEVDELAVQEAIRSMRRIQAAGKTLVTVFHSPKGFNGDRALIDMISGSSRLARYPEAVLGLLNHAEGADLRVFSTILRNQRPADDETLRLEGVFRQEPTIPAFVETAASRKKLTEEKAKAALAEQGEELKIDNIRAAITGFICHSPESLATSRDITANVRGASSQISAILRQMRDNGEIVSVQEQYVTEAGTIRDLHSRNGGRTFLTTPQGAENYRAKMRREAEELRKCRTQKSNSTTNPPQGENQYFKSAVF